MQGLDNPLEHQSMGLVEIHEAPCVSAPLWLRPR